ncbi:DUF1826 domain-containing protein [Parasedimentitalea huanghaiensis]|uniref:DUF1826 domain-containing protein n=1 Tax=Parasedimentitalea huanghaiensis TaxID=2682100 RepID=A0A6L6WH73_9RHOB|nr:DUF1826 domain-containing protein [Zongyanglinia huanghaiensis]MVO16800.1 DUF1826 domain-containing protein [Zongyanglinia huanghaiensis]
MPVGVDMVENAEGLSVIHRPDCAAVIWRRPLRASIQSWIDGLAPEQLPKARIVLPIESVRDAVVQICESRGTPDCKNRTILIEDVTALAKTFSGLVSSRYLRLRLDVVTTNACRKFHVDAVTTRLICTYRGTGTQYGNGQGNADPKRIFTAPTGAAILLRGTQWPEQPRSGLMHRSPPIQGTGETRLLLVLDPVPNPSGF